MLLHDGSPPLPTPIILWDLVDKLGITVMGTRAKWLAVLKENLWNYGQFVYSLPSTHTVDTSLIIIKNPGGLRGPG